MVGETVFEPLAIGLIAPTPLLMEPLVAFALVQESVVEPPDMIEEAPAASEQVGSGSPVVSTNVAVQVLLLFIVTVPFAEQSPPQPANVEPVEAVAVSASDVPATYCALQTVFPAGQLKLVVV